MSLKIEENIELAPFTTLHVGGWAKYLTEVHSLPDVISALEFASKNNLPVFVMSGGSNILISDTGFAGLVILNKIKGIESEVQGDKIIVTSGAGEEWNHLVKFAAENNWAGIETLAGIPGSVGAAPVQNIGAYGAEASSVIKEVIAYDLDKNSIVTLANKECEFGYRKSIFNSKYPGRYIILEVVFELKTSGEPNLSYQDLQKYFEARLKDGPKPTVHEIYKAVIEIRARKGMVIHPDYESYQSAGSFFKNPVVSAEVFEKVKEKITDTDKWFWEQSDGSVKISAAKLIEKAGFPKGFKKGNAGISPKHSLSLINLGGAKANELIDLAKEIIKEVQAKFGVEIKPEVLTIGFSENPFFDL